MPAQKACILHGSPRHQLGGLLTCNGSATGLVRFMTDGMGCMWPVWLIGRTRMSMVDMGIEKENKQINMQMKDKSAHAYAKNDSLLHSLKPH